LQLDAINDRHDAVEELVHENKALAHLKELLSPIRDLERLIIKIGAATPSPRDIVGLKNSLKPQL
jgi:DNA mismatch repair protein MutS